MAAGERVRLHVSLDILLMDAWSMRTLSRELGRLYVEPEAELPVLEVTFRHYVLAERSFQASQLYQTSRSYWRQRSAELPPAPELPLAQSPETLDQPRFTRRTGFLPPH